MTPVATAIEVTLPTKGCMSGGSRAEMGRPMTGELRRRYAERALGRTLGIPGERG